MRTEEYAAYVQRIGPPRVTSCCIDLIGSNAYVFRCSAHDLLFNDLPKSLDGSPYQFIDRCPVSRLEEYRASRWAG